MKTLQFNFEHPVKGIVRFFNKSDPNQKHIAAFYTQSGECVICIDQLHDGEWKASLEWEHDGKDYCYEKEFEVADA